VIFLDSNVPMYVVGTDHDLCERARRVLGGALRHGDRLVTSAEIFQELIHRYTCVRRPQALLDAWQLLEATVDETFPIEYEDVAASRLVLESTIGLSARDALHIAIMKRHGVTRILSFDTGFDKVDGIVRLA